MYRKHFFNLIILVTVLFLGGLSAFAQTGNVRGIVKLKQADGTIAPVGNATVDIYRLDVAGARENIKTNKRGEFNVLGLFIVGKYILSVSAPGAAPFIKGGIKPGQDVDIPITLEPGDGRRYAMEEAKKLAAGDNSGEKSGGGESAEDRAKREELMRKNEEIKASNQKVEESNAIYNRVVKEGNAAYAAKNYDEAIAKYSEAITADIDHPGAPVVLTNRSIVLRIRAVDAFNAASKTKDEAGKAAAKKDWTQAAQDAKLAVEKLKAQTPPSEPAAAASYKDQFYRALLARAAIMKFYVPLVDPTQLDAAMTAYQEYLAVEPDPALKLKMQLESAQLLFQAGEIDKSITAYKQVLVVDPENIEALMWVGLALYSTDDPTKYQEAANYLQQFVDKAPDTNENKASAKESLEELKRKDVKPQKPTGRRRG
jgi:tetratricopeptide (TPR) repeat protein